tara:strand:+ start:51 stop:557 length:507 start_codon:yes stop_codon:yes gene_type:complete
MSDKSFIRPVKIPGKRFVLTKSMIEESQKHTKSNMEASRWLGVNYNTYKKWAKYYGVFEQHLNQSGVGVKKGWASYKINLDDILSGRRKSKYSNSMLKKRLIEEGYLQEECSLCGWNEKRIIDDKICLSLDFLDSDSQNTTFENMRLLCSNCYFTNVGNFKNSKHFCK